MDITRWQHLREVFEQASEREGGDRAAFLDSACDDDLALRREVEGMLAVERAESSFLESPAGERSLPGPRSRVGAYEIVRPIASGGMGTVFEAIQDRPNRRVALKMMRLGLFSEGAVHRFEVEAELLARLRHPGIAQIYEAGVHAEHGATEMPWFAMEYVESARDILEHCRAEELGLRAKLALFLEVCEAVSYGHQRGVIHRDLKPANLLVGADGRTKVIDFGVARVTDSDFVAGALATRSGELLGTLHYMSPEQIAGEPDGVDMRSDVYALGLVLYELLCDRLPYELDGLPLVHVALTIENEVPRKLRASDPTLPLDVEWVVLKALEKDPGRRYDSVAGFADDLRRFLGREPVLAAPPSAVYRARRFARKHWRPLAAASIVVLALAVGTAVATAGLLRARTENAKFSDLNDMLVDTLSSATLERGGRDVRVADMLDDAREQIPVRLARRPLVEAAMHRALGKSYQSLGLYAEAIEEDRAALALWDPRVDPGDLDRLETLESLARVLLYSGQIVEARTAATDGAEAAATYLGRDHPAFFGFERIEVRILFEEGEHEAAEGLARAALQRSRAALGTDHEVTHELLMELELTLRHQSKWTESEALSRELLALAERSDGPESYRALVCKLRLGTALSHLDAAAEAQELYEEALPQLTRMRGEEHPATLNALNDLASIYAKRGDFVRAATIYREVVPRFERVLGPEHRDTLNAKAGLATAQQDLGDDQLSIEGQRDVLATQRRIFGPEHPRTVTSETNLAIFLTSAGQFSEAEPLARHSLEVRRRLYGTDDERTIGSIEALGYLFYQRGQFDEAAPLFEEALRARQRVFGATHTSVLRIAQNLGTVLARLERYDEALAVYEEHLRANRAVLEPSDPMLVQFAMNLAELHLLIDEPAQAEEIIHDALATCQAHLPQDHPMVALAAAKLGRCLMTQGRHDEALEFLERAVTIAGANGSVPSSKRSRYQGYLGLCLSALGMRDEAARQLASSIELHEKAGLRLDDNYTEVARALAGIRGRNAERATDGRDD